MISIVIPTLNEEKILERTLTGLRSLTDIPHEVIISDGNSKDATIAIAKRFADKVVEYEGKERQTIGGGRNLGAWQAHGEYLVFMDADVFIPGGNEFFKQAIALFEQDKRLEGLTVFLKVLPEHVTLSDALFFGLVNRIYQFSNNVLHKGAASGEFQMMRRATFEKIGGFNEALAVGEDNELFSRLSKIGKTRIASGLHVMHTSRRAHNIGWAKLLSFWIGNLAYTKVTKKPLSKEWKVIR